MKKTSVNNNHKQLLVLATYKVKCRPAQPPIAGTIGCYDKIKKTMKTYPDQNKTTRSRAYVSKPFFSKHNKDPFFSKDNFFGQSDFFKPTIQLKTAGENSTGMPDNLKFGVEKLSGIDMSDVKVHHNSSKPDQINALAFAQGTDIHLGRGQEKHLPHEAWHVVQQKQRRVNPTVQMQANINNDTGLEKEAGVMGAKALQIAKQEGSPQSKPPLNTTLQRKKSPEGVLQLYKEYTDEGEADLKNTVHWKSNGVPLRVAEDGTAAIAQARASGGQEMYVDTTRLAGINSDLKNVNAPVEFVEKGGGTVEGAAPANLEGSKKTLAQVEPVEPADHSTAKEIPNDCGNAARTVTGSFAEGKTLKAKYNDADGQAKNTSRSNPELMKYELMAEHFGAEVTDSSKIVEDIEAYIKSKNELWETIEPYWNRIKPISEALGKLRDDFKAEIDSLKMRVEAHVAIKNALPAGDPKNAEIAAAIDTIIQALHNASNAYRDQLNKKAAELQKKWRDILAEKIGGKTVHEVFDEYSASVREYQKLKAAIMKPYNDQSVTDKEKFDEKVGINRYSNPNVGEAHTISSGGNNYEGMSTWNFHWGGVIFKSTTGSDNITMENYAGNEDSQWRLQMYGIPTKENARYGQTFHEAHEATRQHGDNPTTLTTEKK